MRRCGSRQGDFAVRNAERAQGKIDELAAAGLAGTVKFVYNDASKDETYVSAVEQVVADEGCIDVLVSNFGTSNPAKDLDIEHTDPQEFIDTVDINLKSVFITSQVALKYMAERKSGSIINISSIGGAVPDISQIPRLPSTI